MAGIAQPDVIVDFRVERGALHLDLSNIGDGPACAVRVKFKPEFRGLGGERSIPEMRLFHATEFLPAGKTISTFVDSIDAYFVRKEPTKIRAKVSYADRDGKRFSQEVKHDLEIYRDIVFLEKTETPS